MSKHVSRAEKLLAEAEQRERIALHCEGGRAYDGVMRRLVAAGYATLRRIGHRFHGAGHRTTYFILTDKGKALLRERGYPEPKRRPCAPINTHPGGRIADGDPRCLLVGGERHTIALLRPVRPGEEWQEPRHLVLTGFDGEDDEEEVLPPEEAKALPRYVAESYKDGAMVWYRPRRAFLWIGDHEMLIKAGRLRRTGRGLVLEPYQTFRFRNPQEKVPEEVLNERLAVLAALAPGITFQMAFSDRVWQAVYLHCHSDVEVTVVRMLIPEAQPFAG